MATRRLRSRRQSLTSPSGDRNAAAGRTVLRKSDDTDDEGEEEDDDDEDKGDFAAPLLPSLPPLGRPHHDCEAHAMERRPATPFA